MINISLAAFALWQLVVPGDYGLVLNWTTLTPGFVVFGAMAVITCVATTGMIRFPEKDIRWTGRLFVCGLPAAFIVLTGINALI